MKNSFIRHIFNVKRQRDTLHGNKNFIKLLVKLTNISESDATHISIRDICSNKFLSYIYALSCNVPTSKIYHYGNFGKCKEIPENCVIKYDKGQDGIYVLCLKKGENIYNEEIKLIGELESLIDEIKKRIYNGA